MADQKISELTAIDALASGDLVAVVDDPGGTPSSKKATIAQVQDFLEAAENVFTAKQTINRTGEQLALGVAGENSGVMSFSGAITGKVTVQAANNAGTYSLTLPTNDGDAGQFLKTDGSGVLSWDDVGTGAITSSAYTMATDRLLGRSSAGTGAIEEISIGTGLTLAGGSLTASGTVAGSDTELQFNDSGAFGADAGLTYNKTSNTLKIAAGALAFDGSSSGTVTIQPAAAAGTYTLTLPTSDGDNGQALTTDGSGALSWSTIAATPGGSDTQVQFNDGGAFGGDAGLTFNKTSKALTLGGATVTTSSPVIDAAQTWNDGAVTFTGLKFNATDTASASGSLLMDLQVGGASRFSVTKGGAFGPSNPRIAPNASSLWFDIVITGVARSRIGNGYFEVNSSGVFQFSSAGSPGSADLFLTRRAAANLRLGAADAAAPVAQTLSVQSASATGADQAGANFTITGSQGRGGGAGGSIIFQVAPAGTPGSGAQNALATALTIGSNKNITFHGSILFSGSTVTASGANNFFSVSSLSVGGETQFGNGFGGLNVSGGYAILSGRTATTGVLLSPGSTSNTVEQRNGTNAQAFRVYNTYTSATNFERANIFWDSNVLKIGTEKGSAGGTARALEFQTDGTTKLTISTTGNATITGWFKTNLYFDAPAAALGGNGGIYFGTAGANGSQVQSTGAGVIAVGNYGGNDFNRLQFGGTTSSFPALKRSSASLIVRLADDTANAALESASLKTDAPTGGTAATWKLGTVASVSPTSPNRTIEVDIGGTIYYLSAKTTND